MIDQYGAKKWGYKTPVNQNSTTAKRAVPRLAVVMSHPIQYWAPVYRGLAESKQVELAVFFVAENGAYEYYDAEFEHVVKWDIPLTEGYANECLNPGLILGDYGFFSVDARRVLERVNAFSPDFVLINGYAQRVNWRLRLGLPKHTKLLYISDSNLDNKRSWWRARLKHWIIAYFFRRVHLFFACGPKNKAYLLHYGAANEAIVDSTLPVDAQRLVAQYEQMGQDGLEHLRQKLGIDSGDLVLLFVGKLMSHKRPEDLIEAVAHLRAQNLAVCAVIVGSGTLLSELKRLASDLGVEHAINFTGFVNQSKIGPYFALSDALVFSSSREAFGLIASEALAFGLPILASDGVGAVGASILHDKNALVYPCGDVECLAKYIKRLLVEPDLLPRLSRQSTRMTHQFDKTVVVDHILAACNREKS